MKFISHRGNLHGPNTALENDPIHLLSILRTTSYDIEVDVWSFNSLLLLSHDLEDKKKITFEEFDHMFSSYKNRLWVHCKNIEALIQLSKTSYNCFGHNDDSFVLTSKLNIFTKPGIISSDSITVMPELIYDDEDFSVFNCKGILTDYPIKYEAYYNSIRS